MRRSAAFGDPAPAAGYTGGSVRVFDGAGGTWTEGPPLLLAGSVGYEAYGSAVATDHAGAVVAIGGVGYRGVSEFDGFARLLRDEGYLTAVAMKPEAEK